LQTGSEWLHVDVSVVRFFVRIMILRSSPFNIVTYLARSHAGVSTPTSCLRPCHYNFPSPATDLLCCMSESREKKYPMKWETIPKMFLRIRRTGKLHLDLTVIQKWWDICWGHLYWTASNQHKKNNRIKVTNNVKLIHFLYNPSLQDGCDAVRPLASGNSRGFHWLPTCIQISDSDPLNKVIVLPVSIFGLKNRINGLISLVLVDHR